MMKTKKIAILGGGNIGAAIAEGLAKNSELKPSHITVTRRRVDLLGHLQDQGIQVTMDNIQAVADSQVIILAVQPTQVHDLLVEIKSKLDPKKNILISVAAGVTLGEIEKTIGSQIPLFRAMPNTAVAIRESMTCIASQNGDNGQKDLVLGLFNQLGSTILIREELMSAATVLAACGVAYSMRFIRAASQGGIEIGFDAHEAQAIAAQTVKGAAALLLSGGKHPEREIDKVTTPRGCTIAGLNEMEHQGFSSALIKGIVTSYEKISRLTEQK